MRNLIWYFIFFGVAFPIHYFVNEQTESLEVSRLISSYIFLLTFSVLIFISLIFIKKVDHEKVGMAFLVGAVLKMLGAAVFILAIKLPRDASSYDLVINFFSLFFPLLILDSYLVVKKIVQS